MSNALIQQTAHYESDFTDERLPDILRLHLYMDHIIAYAPKGAVLKMSYADFLKICETTSKA